MYVSPVGYHPCVCASVYFHPITSPQMIATIAIRASPVDTCTFSVSHESCFLSKAQQETQTAPRHEARFFCKLIFFP